MFTTTLLANTTIHPINIISVVRTIKILFLSNFDVSKTALLSTITMLCVRPTGLHLLLVASLQPQTSVQFPHNPQPPF